MFNGTRNYTGTTPPLTSTPLLAPYLDLLANELEQTPGALVVPLGKAVTLALTALTDRGSIDSKRCLFGFPHPSGANAHRKRQYDENRREMAAAVEAWFKG